MTSLSSEVNWLWYTVLGLPRWHGGKESACLQKRCRFDPGSGRSPGRENGNPLQYSCQKIPWTEEPGGLQSMMLRRVRHDWATKHSMLTPGVEISQISQGLNGYREGETESKTRGLPSSYFHSKQSNQGPKATDQGTQNRSLDGGRILASGL